MQWDFIGLTETEQDALHDSVPFIAGILSAMILRWAAYRWPSGYHGDKDAVPNDPHASEAPDNPESVDSQPDLTPSD